MAVGAWHAASHDLACAIVECSLRVLSSADCSGVGSCGPLVALLSVSLTSSCARAFFVSTPPSFLSPSNQWKSCFQLSWTGPWTPCASTFGASWNCETLATSTTGLTPLESLFTTNFDMYSSNFSQAHLQDLGFLW
ncbi:hypothetical protein EV121DRAFT_294358 [Schizophyllum commune]